MGEVVVQLQSLSLVDAAREERLHELAALLLAVVAASEVVDEATHARHHEESDTGDRLERDRTGLVLLGLSARDDWWKLVQMSWNWNMDVTAPAMLEAIPASSCLRLE